MLRRHRLGMALAAMLFLLAPSPAEAKHHCAPGFCQGAYDECIGLGYSTTQCMSMWTYCHENCHGWQI
jgi:hypothetical protein